ncbi:hypothetical protein [Hymenobacter glaciei]|uniref:hypothetical protein n=1 Tax=Hymenobacter glaciei TaxID=877209 RepID=UPI0031EDB68D
MRNSALLAGGVVLAVAAGCSSAPETGQWVGDLVTASDYEAVAGWVPGATSLSRDHAHSGRFADRIDAEHTFGLTFQLPLNQASVHALRGLDVEAWTYFSSLKSGGALQVQVWAHGPGQDAKPLYEEQLNLREQVTDSCHWTQVHRRFTLPDNLPGDANLRLFIWGNPSTKPVYFDDLRVKALE